MKFFQKRNRKQQKNEQLPQPPGLNHFVSVLELSHHALPGDTNKMYRAGMFGAFVAATLSIEQIPKFKSLWAEGDLIKARQLTEVWASTITLHMAQNAHQDSVCRDIATSFASVVFHSDLEVSYRELRSYQLQLSKDAELNRQGGIAAYALDFLYLRCLKALGHDLDLQRLPSPVPIPSIAYLMDQRLIPEDDLRDISGFEVILPFQALLVESVESAKKQLV